PRARRRHRRDHGHRHLVPRAPPQGVGACDGRRGRAYRGRGRRTHARRRDPGLRRDRRAAEEGRARRTPEDRRGVTTVVDTHLATLSNQLMLGAVLLYVVAMVGYAADIAFGRRRAMAAAPSEAKVLVGAGGPDTAEAVTDDEDEG